MAARRQPADPAVVPQAAAPQVVFALAPGGGANQILDLNSPSGAKFHAKAIAALDHEFDLETDGLQMFLSSLEHRSLTTGWDFNIPVGDGNNLNLVRNYGQISLQQVRAHVDTYSNTESRQAQNSRHLFLCIMASLTKEATAHMILFANQYTSNGQPSGMLLLKLIVTESHVDTNATITIMRERLSSLDKKMPALKSNVKQFNKYVMSQLHALEARGQRTEDLLVNLFKGYMAASDKTFRNYILKKQEEFEDGIQIQPHQLMHLALQKYSALIDKGEWNAPTEEEKAITALQSQLKRIVDNESETNDTKKKKGKKNGKGKKSGKERPAWMSEKPKEGESQKKMVNGKQYWWCTNHKMWCRHSTEQCEHKGIKNDDANPPESDKKNSRKDKKMKLARALTSVIEQSDDEEDDN